MPWMLMHMQPVAGRRGRAVGMSHGTGACRAWVEGWAVGMLMPGVAGVGGGHAHLVLHATGAGRRWRGG